MNERIERLNTMVDEGRIIRNDWVGTDEQGRETACLLAALSPEVVGHRNASACPAELMPGWMAYLTPWIDDNASEAEWPRIVRRYAACAARWSSLDEAAWRRVEVAARRSSVVEAMSHTTQEDVLNVSRAVLAWLAEGMPEQSRDALWATVEAVMVAATEAGATVAVTAAAWASLEAVGAAAAAVRAAAAEATVAGARAHRPWAARRRAAAAGAADRIIDAILIALEKECEL
jgi:hypothetical protein